MSKPPKKETPDLTMLRPADRMMYVRGQAILDNPQSTPAQKALAKRAMHNLMALSRKHPKESESAPSSMRPRMQRTYQRAQETIDNPTSTPAQKALACRAQKRLEILSQKPTRSAEPELKPVDRCFIDIHAFAANLARSIEEEAINLSWDLDRQIIAKRTAVVRMALEDESIQRWFKENGTSNEAEVDIGRSWYRAWSKKCPQGHSMGDEKEALVALAAAHLQATRMYGACRSKKLLDQLFGFDLKEQREWQRRQYRRESSSEAKSRHWALVLFASAVGSGVGIAGTLSPGSANFTNAVGGLAVFGFVYGLMQRGDHLGSIENQKQIKKAWAETLIDEKKFEAIHI